MPKLKVVRSSRAFFRNRLPAVLLLGAQFRSALESCRQADRASPPRPSNHRRSICPTSPSPSRRTVSSFPSSGRYSFSDLLRDVITLEKQREKLTGSGEGERRVERV